MSGDRDFGDIVGDVLTARAEDSRAKNEAAKAKREAERKEFETKFRPLLAALAQTQAKYPKADIYDYEDGSYSEPNFFLSGNDYVRLAYDEARGVCSIIRSSGCSGGNSTLASSANVEDLLPPLIDLLATAVAYSLKR
jgi:hypothetical protein